MTAEIFFGLRGVGCFVISFLKKLFSKNSLKIRNCQPHGVVVSGYNQFFQIWPPKITAEIILVFEIWRYIVFFCENYQNLKFSTLFWPALRVKSAVAQLVSKYDCSNPFGFREMAFYMISFLFLHKT